MMSADHLKKSELKSIWQFTIIEIQLPFFKLGIYLITLSQSEPLPDKKYYTT